MFYVQLADSKSPDGCLIAFNYASALKEKIYYLLFVATDTTQTEFYGNNYCSSNGVCLKNLTEKDMTDFCMQKNINIIVLYWRYK